MSAPEEAWLIFMHRWCGDTSDLEKFSVRLLIVACASPTVLLTVTVMADLLHAGASYLRIHQNGFGAVGVSTKYGKRAFARYPIFWGMKDIGGLPNPDPTDTASWSGKHVKAEDIPIDEELEASKPRQKRQAQNWAGFVASLSNSFPFKTESKTYLERSIALLISQSRPKSQTEW